MTEGAAAADPVRLEVADGVATITLARPAALNALDGSMKDRLLAVFRQVDRDRAVRAVILTGEGRAFCAGQDLRESFGGADTTLEDVLRDRYNPLILAIRHLSRPVIGAINGVAAGAGCSLALACDLRIAAEGASFVLAFGRIGLVPDSGASWFLPRLVGRARAMEMALVGDPLSAADAERWGLVSRVVAADALLDEARAMAVRLTAGSPRAMALTKRALAFAETATLEQALANEASLQGIAGRSADHAEGLAAFREKRSPRFTGE